MASGIIPIGSVVDSVIAPNGFVKFSNGFAIAWATVQKTSSSVGAMGVNYYYDFTFAGHNLMTFTDVYFGLVSVDARYFWGLFDKNYSSTSWGTVRLIRGSAWTDYTATLTVAIFGQWA